MGGTGTTPELEDPLSFLQLRWNRPATGNGGAEDCCNEQVIEYRQVSEKQRDKCLPWLQEGMKLNYNNGDRKLHGISSFQTCLFYCVY